MDWMSCPAAQPCECPEAGVGARATWRLDQQLSQSNWPNAHLHFSQSHHRSHLLPVARLSLTYTHLPISLLHFTASPVSSQSRGAPHGGIIGISPLLGNFFSPTTAPVLIFPLSSSRH